MSMRSGGAPYLRACEACVPSILHIAIDMLAGLGSWADGLRRERPGPEMLLSFSTGSLGPLALCLHADVDV